MIEFERKPGEATIVELIGGGSITLHVVKTTGTRCVLAVEPSGEVRRILKVENLKPTEPPAYPDPPQLFSHSPPGESTRTQDEPDPPESPEAPAAPSASLEAALEAQAGQETAGEDIPF